MPSLRTQWLSLASFVLLALLALSGVDPYDRATWVMEVLPVMLALPILWLTYRRFPLTTLLYTCIFFHAGVLMLGGVTALTLCSRVHDQQLERMGERGRSG